MYTLPNIIAATIVSAIQDTLARLNLALNKTCGQCYNGPSTMHERFELYTCTVIVE